MVAWLPRSCKIARPTLGVLVVLAIFHYGMVSFSQKNRKFGTSLILFFSDYGFSLIATYRIFIVRK
jgi:hypothetical protein